MFKTNVSLSGGGQCGALFLYKSLSGQIGYHVFHPLFTAKPQNSHHQFYGFLGIHHEIDIKERQPKDKSAEQNHGYADTPNRSDIDQTGRSGVTAVAEHPDNQQKGHGFYIHHDCNQKQKVHGLPVHAL